MDQLMISLILFGTFCHWAVTELVVGLFSEMTWGTGFHLILWPAVMSGALALLVKYLIALRLLPVYKLLSGSLLLVLLGWYLDRICQNNAFLLVRSVGCAILFCAALGVAIVSEDRFAQSPRPEAKVAVLETVAAQDYLMTRD